MTVPDGFHAASTRRLHPPRPDTIRLWTIQPLSVWDALQEQKTLLVDPEHPGFLEGRDGLTEAYEWMRQQMAQRIPGYEGHYPWWAYKHFLDLRFYRWHCSWRGERLVRLELAVPITKVLLSSYDAWACVFNRWYLPQSLSWEEFERETEAWEAEALRDGVDVDRHHPLAEPWESQMQQSWERIFDVNERHPADTIQATFERLELTDVVKVTEFTSMPRR